MKRLLINSLPKSGTHLLAKAVELFGYKEYFTSEGYVEGTPIFFSYKHVKNSLKNASVKKKGVKISIGALTPFFIDSAILHHWLNIIPANRYTWGHIPYTPTLAPIIKELNYSHFFIIRDPRAVVASQIPFILSAGEKMPGRHFLEDDFKDMSPADRLNFFLEGGDAKKAGVKIKSFQEVYRSMLLWKDDPNCLFIRFEELIGEKGGGTREQQNKIMKRISLHIGVPVEKNTFIKSDKIYDTDSRTFVSGRIDGWKTSMDKELRKVLCDYCEPLCREAGYTEENR